MLNVFIIFNAIFVSVLGECLIKIGVNECNVCKIGFYSMDEPPFLESSCLTVDPSVLKYEILVHTLQSQNAALSSSFINRTLNLDEVIETLHEQSRRYSSSEISIYLTNEQHIIRSNILKKNLFRHSMVNLKFETISCGLNGVTEFCFNLSNKIKAKLSLKTENIYLFISKTFTITNIEFQGLDLVHKNQNNLCHQDKLLQCCDAGSLSDPNNKECFIQGNTISEASSIYGLFNLEYIDDSNIIPQLVFINSTFINFYNIYRQNGFNSIVRMNDLPSDILIDNLSIKDSIIPFILFKDYVSLLGKLQHYDRNYYGEYIFNVPLALFDSCSLKITNFLINNYNYLNVKSSISPSFVFINNLDFPFQFTKFFGNEINALVDGGQFLISTQNISKPLILDTIVLNQSSNICFLQSISSNIQISNLKITNLNSNLNPVILTAKYSKISLLNIRYEKSSQPFFEISDSNISINYFESFDIQTKENLYKGVNTIFFGSNILLKNISNSFIRDDLKKSIFKNSKESFSLINTTITQSMSDSLFTLNERTILIHFENCTFDNYGSNYIFSSDISFKVMELLLTTISNEFSSFLSLNEVSLDHEIMIKNCNFINLTFNHSNYFFRHSYTNLTIEDSLFENLTVNNNFNEGPYFIFKLEEISTNKITRTKFINCGYDHWLETFYRNGWELIIVGVWSSYSIDFIDCIFYGSQNKVMYDFIGTSLVDLRISIVNTTFTNAKNKEFGFDNYALKGISLTTPKIILLSNNTFENLICNKKVNWESYFISNHAAIQLFSVMSQTVNPNTFTATVSGNIFKNITCNNFGGALSIVNYHNIIMKQNRFMNNKARNGGHLAIIASTNVSIENNTFMNSLESISCVYIYNILKNFTFSSNIIENTIGKNNIVLQINKIQNGYLIGNKINNSLNLENFSGIQIDESSMIIKDAKISGINSNIFGSLIKVINSNEISFQNLRFENCITQSLGLGIYLDDISDVKIDNLEVLNSTGNILYTLSVPNYELLNLKFFNISLSSNPLIYYLSFTKSSKSNSIILNNSKSYEIHYQNISIRYIRITEGPIFFYSSSNSLLLDNVTVENSAGIFSTSEWMYLVDIYYVNINLYNFSTIDYSFYFSESNFECYFCNFSYIYAVDSIFLIVNSNANVINCSISNILMNNSKEERNVIFYYKDSTFNLLNFISSNAAFLNSHLILAYVENSIGTLNNVTLNKYYSSLGLINFIESNVICINILVIETIGISIMSTNSNLTLNYTTVASISVYGGDKYTYLTIENSVFLGDFHIFGFIFKTNVIRIMKTSFRNIVGLKIRGLDIQLSDDVSIQNSNFENLNSLTGAGIKSSLNKIISISDCQFTNNSANYGASIFSSEDLYFSISNTTFDQNIALKEKDKGGIGIIYHYSPFCECNISSIDCKCLYKNAKILTKNLTFTNNYAEFIIPTIFTSYKDFTLDIAKFENNTSSISSELTYLALNPENINISISNITLKSGQLSKINYQIFSQLNGNLFEFDNISESTIKFSEEILNISVSGNINKSSKGQLSFDNFLVKYSPGSEILMQIELKMNAKDNFQFIPNFNKVFQIQARIAECSVGEYFSKDMCLGCENGTYSLEKGNDIFIPDFCKNCPNGAVCEGRNIIYPKPEYYRYSKTSTLFFECPVQGACLGTNDDQCAPHHKGPFCNDCEEYYGKPDNGLRCERCGEQNLLTAGKLIGIYLLVTFYVSAVSFYLIVLKLKNDQYLNALLNIFLNHLQILSLLSINIFNIEGLQFSFIEELTQYVSFLKAGLVTSECYLKEFSEASGVTRIAVRQITLLILPFLILLGCLLYIVLAKKFSHHNIHIKRYTAKIKKVNLVVLFVTLNFFYPVLLFTSLSFFNCFQISNDPVVFVIRADPIIECSSSIYLALVLSLAFPGILIFGLMYPSILIYLLNYQKILFRKKKKLKSKNQSTSEASKSFNEQNSDSFHERLSSNPNEGERLYSFQRSKYDIINYIINEKVLIFFTEGYKENYCFWEGYKMIIKFSLAFNANLETYIGKGNQNAFNVIILTTYFTLFCSKRPYEYKQCNYLEFFSLTLLLLSVLEITFETNLSDSSAISILKLLLIILNFILLIIFLFLFMKAVLSFMIEMKTYIAGFIGKSFLSRYQKGSFQSSLRETKNKTVAEKKKSNFGQSNYFSATPDSIIKQGTIKNISNSTKIELD